MQLISTKKLTGAKRNFRRYEVENFEDFSFKDYEIIDNEIEVHKDEESYFLDAVSIFRDEQKERLEAEYRVKNVIKVKDSTNNQGTKEWLNSRMGIVTASDTPFNKDGKKIPSFDEYVDKKVTDKLLSEMGIQKENFKSEAMERGNELEHFAIKEYKKITGNEVVEKGLVVGEELPIGASTDGIAIDESFSKVNIEIKSVFLKNYIAELTRGTLTKKYYAQMQTQMFVLDIDVTHFLVQCQEVDTFKLIIREVHRDEEFICNLIETLKEFEVAFNRRYKEAKAMLC
jgi:predicted phage-related endonuclease